MGSRATGADRDPEFVPLRRIIEGEQVRRSGVARIDISVGCGPVELVHQQPSGGTCFGGIGGHGEGEGDRSICRADALLERDRGLTLVLDDESAPPCGPGFGHRTPVGMQVVKHAGRRHACPERQRHAVIKKAGLRAVRPEIVREIDLAIAGVVEAVIARVARVLDPQEGVRTIGEHAGPARHAGARPGTVPGIGTIIVVPGAIEGRING